MAQDGVFPEGFLWGTAMSGFQVEMGRGPVDSNSDWFKWVHDRENIRSGVVSGDLPEDGPGFWELYEEDLLRARKELNNNAVRLSVEWSRIFPHPTLNIPARVIRDRRGNVERVDIPKSSMDELEKLANESAVKRYREILRKARELGLEILLTVYHWPLPLWLHDPIECKHDLIHAEKRGWLSDATIVEFAKLSAYVAKAFGDLVDLYATINEPIVVAFNGYLSPKTGFPPGLKDLNLALRVLKSLAIAHGIAYEQIKRWDRVSASRYGPATVGIVQSLRLIKPYDAKNPDDVEAAEIWWYAWNEWILNAVIQGDYDMCLDMVVDSEEKFPNLVKGCDYLGVNYYRRQRVKGVEGGGYHPIFRVRAVPCEGDCTDFGWEIYPKGMREILNWAYRKYRRKVIITENGIADASGEKRPRYLLDHLREVHKAIDEDGIPVKGYFHWSLIDNYEWARGFEMRFGLYKVDYRTKERIPTKAVELYGRICRENALPKSST
ncbi:MAG: glycoside hydrolase family 1 protein [Thaumarchaeota archaeon]|nr:MAG: glycoside hydrolase family 1 protein [Nitrososphaerota archaeon]